MLLVVLLVQTLNCFAIRNQTIGKDIEEIFQKFEYISEKSVPKACYMQAKGFVECSEEFEEIDGKCYETCGQGFSGIKDLCVPQTSMLIQMNDHEIPPAYRRKMLPSDKICTSPNVLMKESCLTAPECPKRYPNRCGILCTPTTKDCDDIIIGTVKLLENLLKKLKDGDLSGSVGTLLELYRFLNSFPSCDRFKAQTFIKNFLSTIMRFN